MRNQENNSNERNNLKTGIYNQQNIQKKDNL